MLVWVRRILLLVLELLGAVIAGAAVLAALLAWRLTEGPLRIEAIEPQLVSSLTELAAPYKVSLGDTAIAWGHDPASIGFEASSVRVMTADGATVITLPKIEVGISVPALLFGRVAPSYITLIGARLHIFRLADGTTRLSLLEAEAPSTEGSGDLLSNWLDALSHPPAPSSQLGALRRIEISRARLAMDDYQFGLRWLAPQADLQLYRNDDGIRGNLALQIENGAAPVSFKGGLLYSISRGDLQMHLSVDRFNPAELAARSPSFAALSRFNVPLGGKLDVRVVRPIGVAQVGFDLVAGKGQAGMVEGEKPLDVAYAQLAGRIDRQNRSAEISRLYVDFDGPKLEAEALAQRVDDKASVTANVSVSHMPASELARFWPLEAAPGARSWVTENITTGRVPKAEVRAAVSFPLLQPEALTLQSFEGHLDVEGATVHYLKPLPPATDVKGFANFDAGSFHITIENGQVGGIKLAEGKVDLLGLNDDGDRAEIDITVTGALKDQMQLLDTPPLGYMRRLNINPALAEGVATTKARFMFPLFSDLPIEQVAIAASSRMENVGIPALVAGQALSKAQLDLVLDGGGMKITGNGLVGPAAAQFVWNESFLSDVSPGSEISFTGNMDEAARQAFRISWPYVLTGQVGVTGTYSKDSGQPAKLETQLDFAKARLALPWFAWAKPEGVAATGKATTIIDHNEVKAVQDFSVSGSGMRAVGRVDFAPGSKWQSVTLSKVSTPGTDLAGQVVNRGENGFALNFKGTKADIRGIYDEAEAEAAAALAAPVPAEPRLLTPIDVTFDIAQVVTGEGRELRNMIGRVVRNTRGWSQLALDGVANSTPFRIRLHPTSTGRHLEMTTKDAGAMLLGLHLMDSIREGQLEVMGEGVGNNPIEATAELKSFRYLNAETLKRIAQAADPNSGAELDRSEGLSFSRLKTRITYTEGLIEVKEGRMAGDLMGLTLAGNIDLLAGKMAIQGTWVPLYGVNSIVGGIPVLGWLLTGGQGGGVFAATYSVSGSISAPETSVNPLAMLAPGILRNILFLN